MLSVSFLLGYSVDSASCLSHPVLSFRVDMLLLFALQYVRGVVSRSRLCDVLVSCLAHTFPISIVGFFLQVGFCFNFYQGGSCFLRALCNCRFFQGVCAGEILLWFGILSLFFSSRGLKTRGFLLLID